MGLHLQVELDMIVVISILRLRYMRLYVFWNQEYSSFPVGKSYPIKSPSQNWSLHTSTAYEGLTYLLIRFHVDVSKIGITELLEFHYYSIGVGQTVHFIKRPAA
jgi:hypothetical protein